MKTLNDNGWETHRRLEEGEGGPSGPVTAFARSKGRAPSEQERSSVMDFRNRCSAELIHRRAPWKTRESVQLATLEWLSWFNDHRLMAPLGYVPPAEFKADYYRNLEQQATSA